jgi:hypothetical protein
MITPTQQAALSNLEMLHANFETNLPGYNGLKIKLEQLINKAEELAGQAKTTFSILKLLTF